MSRGHFAMENEVCRRCAKPSWAASCGGKTPQEKKSLNKGWNLIQNKSSFSFVRMVSGIWKSADIFYVQKKRCFNQIKKMKRQNCLYAACFHEVLVFLLSSKYGVLLQAICGWVWYLTWLPTDKWGMHQNNRFVLLLGFQPALTFVFTLSPVQSKSCC